MKSDSANLSKWIAIVILTVLCVFLSVQVAIAVRDRSESKAAYDYGIACSFLDTYFKGSGRSDSERETELSVYFADGEISEIISDLDLVCFTYSNSWRTYTAELVSPGFAIVRLQDQDGNDINPPIGFWFKIDSSSGTFEEWRVGRLQPFSRYDEEYSEVWDASN